MKLKEKTKEGIQKLKRVKVGFVGEVILASIAVVGAVSVLILFPGIASAIKPFLKKKSYKQRDVEKSLESLIRAGLVRRSTDAHGNVKVELTKKGKWEAFLRAGSHDTRSKKWDGVWRVVIFDVPLSKNEIRKELRRAMRLYGFKLLQRSVWVYPFACDDFVALLKSNLGIANDVLYMKVSYIENDKYLRKEFGVQ